MNEDFLHYLWKFKKFPFQNLKTTQNELIEIIQVGEHNFNSGPDFFNARLKIDNQLWAGNVEIHLKSSDWYLHNHENDENYNNVILHVVWDHDVEIFRNRNIPVPTLELKNFVSDTILAKYFNLFYQSKKFINCENDIALFDSFLLKNWVDRLYIERLEEKAKAISLELKKSNNDWEAVLFKMLLKNFGLKVNGDSFYSIGNSIEYAVIRKLQNNQTQLEAVLFGLAGFLNDNCLDAYFIQLKKEYLYLKKKFQLSEEGIITAKFFKLRPSNFPTIRLSQISSLLVSHQNLFSKIIHANELSEFYNLFNVQASEYWKNHYTFGKNSAKSNKGLTKSFIDLLIINTILPLKFCYARSIGSEINESILAIINSVKREENNIIGNFSALGLNIDSALDTQALLQQYNHYCTKNKCLQCAVGNYLIKQ